VVENKGENVVCQGLVHGSIVDTVVIQVTIYSKLQIRPKKFSEEL
jgi:hypothetical protein